MRKSRAESFCCSGNVIYRSNSLPTLPLERNSSVRRKHRVNSVFDNKCCESTKICWWEPDPDYPSSTVDFCLDTSLHGMKYICQPQRHITERIFWIFGLVIGAFAAGWLITDVWLKYINSPLIVTFQPFETTIDQIPFPAITICNMNKVLRSKAEKYIKLAQKNDSHPKNVEARKNVYYLDQVCSSTQSFSQRFNFSLKRGHVDESILEQINIEDGDDEQRDVLTFLKKASQKCPDMLLKCIWEDKVIDCNELFKPVETDFGKCCTFNMVPPSLIFRRLNDSRDDPDEVAEWSKWDIEKEIVFSSEENSKLFPRRQSVAGMTTGLSILLNPDLDEYFCTSSDSQGFRLVKHLPFEVPRVKDLGIAIKPNTEVYLTVKPELTFSAPAVEKIKLDKRNCYFQGEAELAYFNYYTNNNCNEECKANFTFTECGCVLYHMPRDDTRELCGHKKFECAEQIRKVSNAFAQSQSVCSICKPPCTELEYFSGVSYSNIQKESNIWTDNQNLTTRWARNNVSIVHIYFAQDSTYARERKELYGVVDLIANTGGILGLCLGFSALSLIELLYFYTFRAWCRIRRKKSFWTIAALKIHRLWKRTKVRNLKHHHQHQSKRIFREHDDIERCDECEYPSEVIGLQNGPFMTIPLEFNRKLIFGENFNMSQRTSPHMD